MLTEGKTTPGRPLVFARFVVACVVAAALGAAAVIMIWRSRGPEARVGTALPLATSLTVHAFAVTGAAPDAWGATAFADALSERLNRLRGLRAAVGDADARADYALAGDVKIVEGRMVVTARLSRHGARDAFWTGTYWRSSESTATLVDDLAVGTGEALYAEIARRAVSSSKEQR